MTLRSSSPPLLCFIRAWFPSCLWELKRTSAMLRLCWSTMCPISRLVNPPSSPVDGGTSLFSVPVTQRSSDKIDLHVYSISVFSTSTLQPFLLEFGSINVFLLRISGNIFLRSTGPLCDMWGRDSELVGKCGRMCRVISYWSPVSLPPSTT